MKTIYRCEFCGVEDLVVQNVLDHEKLCTENPNNKGIEYYIEKYCSVLYALDDSEDYDRGIRDTCNMIINDLKEYLERNNG